MLVIDASAATAACARADGKDLGEGQYDRGSWHLVRASTRRWYSGWYYDVSTLDGERREPAPQAGST